MKKLFCILIILLLSLTIVEAKFDSEAASNWLSQQKTDKIFEKSFQSLALFKYDSLTASNLALEIRNAGTDCWPSDNCDVRSTALALMALQKSEETTKLDWLLDQQQPSLSGKWLLQIDTLSSGTCTIKEDGTSYTVNIAAGKLSTNLCQTPTSEFDLNSCLKPTLLSTPSKALEIDCSLSTTPHISLLHQDMNEYYVFKSYNTKRQTIHVNNGFFTDIDSTLYANWALKNLGSNINSLIWLKKNYRNTDAVHNSLLYLITNNKFYLTQLVELQDQTEGNFGAEFETAIATLALAKSNQYNSALEKAYEWLGKKQVDGSINADILDTAITLYSFGITEAGPPAIPECTTDAECAGDYICVAGKCKAKSITSTICIANGECEFGENCENCPEDCLKTGEVCCNAVAYLGNCCTDYDCEVNEECISHKCKEKELPPSKKSKAVIWILVIIFIIALLSYLYYSQFYKKGKKFLDLFKKKPPRRPLRPTYRPTPKKRVRIPVSAPRRAPMRKTKVEEELEKSLAEAKKLLKKK